MCDFSDNTENSNWALMNGMQINKWHIDTIAKQNSDKSLYISDTDSTYHCNPLESSYVYAYRLLNFTEAGAYSVGFEWKNTGDRQGATNALRAFLVPANIPLNAGNAYGMTNNINTVPADWIAISAPLYDEQNKWHYFSAIVTVPDANLYNLVFFYRIFSDYWYYSAENPAAIDNIKVSRQVPLAGGVYTIDNTQPTAGNNFNTFTDAFDALNFNGIDDAVTFNIISGQTHDLDAARLRLANIGEATKPVIFQKSGDNTNPHLKFTGSSSYYEGSDYCFLLENAQYITFDGLDISNNGVNNSTYVECGFYINNSSNIIIKNCNIRLRNTSYNYAFYITGNNNHNLFQNNNITNVERGYYFTSTGTNNHIEGGSIDSVYYGIYTYYYSTQTDLTIEKMKIYADNSSGSGIYGIYMSYGNNQRIVNNEIAGFNYGICFYYHNSSDTSYVAYNTVYLQGSNAYYCLYKYTNGHKLLMNNNVFVNKSANNSSACIYSDLSYILPESNNNIYQSATGYVYRSSSLSAKSVNDYKALFTDGTESASQYGDIKFFSETAPYDLHIRTDIPSKAESAGAPLSWVTTDLDGVARNAATPDIGAYEFDGIYNTSDYSPLAGIYTIDITLPTQDRNYNTFREAFDDLHSRGTSDTVTFNVTAGQIYNILAVDDNTRLRLYGVGSADKPIIFQKSGTGANPLLKASGTSSYSDYCFFLDNVQYITFDGLDIQNTGTSSNNYAERGFYLNNASNITVKDCDIRLRNASDNYAFCITNSNNNNLFQNNNITQAYYGYYFYSEGNGRDNHIEGGVIDSVARGICSYWFSGLFGYSRTRQDNLIIEKVKITGLNVGEGIYLSLGNNQNISNCVIAGFGTGIFYEYGSSSDTVTIANNTILTPPDGGVRAIHNANSSRMKLINNIIVNRSTNTGAYCLSNSTNSTDFLLQGSNNNLYFYSSTSWLYNSTGISAKTLNDYKALFSNGAENNSVWGNVAFIRETVPYDLHVRIDVPTKAENGGQPLSWVLTDIDNNPRNNLTPDIGAYEFDGIYDTTDISPLAGIYTIDNTLPTQDRNYNTFREAFDDLHIKGTSDTVTFNVTTGQLHNIFAIDDNTRLQLSNIGSTNKPVIFRKSGTGANPLLKVSGTSSYSDYCFFLYNVQYITFDGLDIENAGTSSNDYVERGFYLNNASYITIKDCNIKLRNASDNYAFHITNANNNNLFQNNNITSASYGYYLGSSGSNNQIVGGGINFVSCGIYEYSFHSIFSEYDTRQDNLIVEKIKIIGENGSTAIELNGGRNIHINNNSIIGFNTGIYLNRAIVGDTVYITHNTILTTNSVLSYSYISWSAPVNTQLKVFLANNIINASVSNCIYDNSDVWHENLLSGSNNNVYYVSPQSYLYSSFSNNVKNINDYKALFTNGAESNSVFGDVAFISETNPYDLHINTAIPTKAENGGQPLSWVLTDLDNNPRNNLTPDIGAYEFDGIYDTADISPLSGVYTIDITLPTQNRNYNTFREAFDALHIRGTSDTVIFNVIAGQVYNIFAIDNNTRLQLTGIGSTDRPIIFQKSGTGANPLLKFTGTSDYYSGSDYGFYMDNVQYITFDGLDMENAGTSSGDYVERGFYLNNISHITVKNCNIRLRNASYNYAFYITGNNNYNLFQNNNITNVEIGYYLLGNGFDNHIINGNIDGVNVGLETYSSYRQDNLLIEQIKIAGLNSNYYGIYIGYGNNQKISNNIITGFNRGIYCLYGSANDTAYIANNTILTPSTGNVYGVNHSSSMKMDIKNNIVANISTGTNSYCIYNSASNNDFLLQNSNNNLYYVNGGKLYGNNSTSTATLTEYQTLLGDNREKQSYQEMPPFISMEYPYNLNLRGDTITAVESGGAPLAWVTTDIEGNPRQGTAEYTGSGMAPDIGAYEFEGKGRHFQTICSGNLTEAINFQNGQIYNVHFTLVNTPQHISGHTVNGVNILPAMELFNNSFLTDSLVYNVVKEGETDGIVYIIKVYPTETMTPDFSNCTPANGDIVSNNNINFSWQPVEGAIYYDVYIWKDSLVASTPVKANFTGINFTYYVSTSGNAGHTYYWKIIARNLCQEIESNVMDFVFQPYLAYPPDLHVTSISHSTPQEGGSMTVTYTVKNDGMGATPPGLTWRDYFWISPDVDVRKDDPVNIKLLEIPNLTSLNPGESYTNTITVTIPQGFMGNYYLFVLTNQEDATNIDFSPAGDVEPVPYIPDISGIPYPYLNAGFVHSGTDIQETNHFDNFFYELIFINPAPTPDFVVSDISHPLNCYSGTSIPLSWKISNQGLANTLPDNSIWYDGVYVTPDSVLNMANAVHLGTFRHNGILQKDSSYTVNQNITVPVSFMGTYHIFVVADVTNAVYESLYKGNNTQMSELPLDVTLTPPCDLMVTDVSCPQQASVRQQINVLFTVKNGGMGATPAERWLDKISMCPDALFNPDNAISLFTKQHIGTLAIDDSYMVTATFTIPDGIQGEYYIFVKTDNENQVFEYLYEDNNTGRSGNAITVLAPDLTIEQITLPVTSITAGEPLTLQYKVKNAGEGSLIKGQWTDTLYFNNIKVAGITHNNITLPDGETYTQSLTFTVPCDVQPTNTIKLVTDNRNTVYESIESNNILEQAVAVIVPDLTADNLQSPAAANSGYRITVDYRVGNHGNARVNGKAVTDRIFFSNTSVLNMQTATLIGQNNYTLTVDTGAYYTTSATVQIPHGTNGNYYIFVTANGDSTICEKAFSNNSTTGNAIAVTLSAAPDLYPVGSSLSDTLHSGYTHNLMYKLVNEGDTLIENQTWREKIYLSNSATFILSQAQLLAEYVHTSSVNIGDTLTLNTSFVIPTTVTVGNYFIHIVVDADNEVYEHNYENNNVSGKAVWVENYPLDIAVSGITAPASASWGQSIAVTFTVENISLLPTLIDRWKDNIYLSANGILDASDIALTRDGITHNSILAAGEQYQVTFNVTLPYGQSGNMYLIGHADIENKNIDVNTANNRFVKAITVNTIPVCDLVIDSLELLTSAVCGQPAQICYRIKNDASVPTSGNMFSNKFYLSPNNQLGSGNLEIATRNIQTVLQPGESYRDTLTITIPLNYNGNWYLLAKTNATNSFYESNTANNLVSLLIHAILPQPCDLTAENITAPETITAGVSTTIQWDVVNIGEASASGQGFREVLYISEDTTFDATDKMLGMFISPLVLPPGASVTHALATRISGVKEGYYYLIVKTNVTRSFNESDFDNNTGVSLYPVYVTLKDLPVNVPLPDTLANNLANDYRLATDTLTGETILISVLSADSLQGAINNLYLMNNDVGDNMRFDLSTDEQLSANPQLYIPSAQPDYYGVTLQGSTPAGNRQDVTLQADILPFSIQSISPDYGGNNGWVTVELRGSKFSSDMSVWLEDDFEFYVQGEVQFVNVSKVYASFYLQDAWVNTVDLVASAGEDEAREPFSIVESTSENLALDLIIPQNPRPNRIIAMTLEYGNTGNTDIFNPVVELTSLTGSPIALTIEGINDNLTELELPVAVQEQRLRPGETGYITIYCKTTNGLLFSITTKK
jgi:hypothetical protein